MGFPIAEMPGIDPAENRGATHAEKLQVPFSDAAVPIGTLALPAVEPDAARMARIVFDLRTMSVLRRLPEVEAWQAGLADDAAIARPAFEDPGVIELAHARGTGLLTIDLAAYPSLQIAAWPHDAAAPPPDAERALRVAVAGVLLEPLLKRLAIAGLGELRVVRVLRGVPGTGNRAASAPVMLSFTIEGRKHTAEVRVDEPLLDTLESLRAAQRICSTWSGSSSLDSSGDSATPYAHHLVPGRLVLGARRLPVQTLHALAPGDVLLRSLASSLSSLVGDAANTAKAKATAVAAWGTPGLVRMHVPVTIDGLKLLVMKEPTMTDEVDPTRTGETLPSDQPDDGIDIGELDLPVQFEVDTIALPLSQLCALRPGYVLELQTPVADAQLKLVAHGQTIGFGELVTVGDHLGVRILRMAHGDGPVQ
ncbi:YscQ/HrcQ family type III secretion apparatus protein [Paraburkholderia sp. NMBU_R16]|uniref:type III secretion system cytoplasmic ring protein SctQ n=1 Tax=Paraburkholderia sp. NMBU_R16 TaxID=2698676 RepID=UPI001566485B|nr:type III secretion system cytoplasmic ring protein SctQ [Paraburkholderia sp. NMBU_R16]NRO95256.1 YscQ/HrcQ family type III secretion apparatus protein [Paraburkholderia sp. NMBU_R16]